jgi:hypothetical protein
VLLAILAVDVAAQDAPEGRWRAILVRDESADFNQVILDLAHVRPVRTTPLSRRERSLA